MPLRSSKASTAALIEPESGPFYGEQMVRDLARFRYALRKFLRFSENAARLSGVTPQQHQLMLGIAGYTGRGSATVSELAEFLQERPHSVVGLIERAVQHGLVRRSQDETDRRVVNVTLTAAGRQVLSRLTQLQQEEAGAIRKFAGFTWPQLRHGPESEFEEQRRKPQVDLTTKPGELRETKGKVRTSDRNRDETTEEK
jgi:DNA-binding MarR family transcriptional regulator